MAFLNAESRNLRPLGDVLAVAFLMFMGLRSLVPLAFHGLRQLRYRQIKIASPDLVIEGVSAYHLVCW